MSPLIQFLVVINDEFGSIIYIVNWRGIGNIQQDPGVDAEFDPDTNIFSFGFPDKLVVDENAEYWVIIRLNIPNSGTGNNQYPFQYTFSAFPGVLPTDVARLDHLTRPGKLFEVRVPFLQ